MLAECWSCSEGQMQKIVVTTVIPVTCSFSVAVSETGGFNITTVPLYKTLIWLYRTRTSGVIP